MSEVTNEMVSKEDYLKVVEENNNLNLLITSLTGGAVNPENSMTLRDEEIIKFNRIIKDKDNLIVKLNDKINSYDINELSEYINKNYPQFGGLKVSSAIISLLEGLKTPEEETYTLTYWYLGPDGLTVKEYRQSGLLKEEYEEMYGMDSDNWLSHTLVKDVKGGVK